MNQLRIFKIVNVVDSCFWEKKQKNASICVKNPAVNVTAESLSLNQYDVLEGHLLDSWKSVSETKKTSTMDKLLLVHWQLRPLRHPIYRSNRQPFICPHGEQGCVHVGLTQ